MTYVDVEYYLLSIKVSSLRILKNWIRRHLLLSMRSHVSSVYIVLSLLPSHVPVMATDIKLFQLEN